MQLVWPLSVIVALGAGATPGKKTAIGALASGLAGGALGNHLDKQAQELQQVADARRIDEGAGPDRE